MYDEELDEGAMSDTGKDDDPSGTLDEADIYLEEEDLEEDLVNEVARRVARRLLG